MPSASGETPFSPCGGAGAVGVSAVCTTAGNATTAGMARSPSIRAVCGTLLMVFESINKQDDDHASFPRDAAAGGRGPGGPPERTALVAPPTSASTLALMCDDDSFDDMVAYRLRRELLSRRGFGSLSLGAGLASLLPIGCKSADPAPGAVPAPTAAAAGAGAVSPPPPGAVATTESEVSI